MTSEETQPGNFAGKQRKSRHEQTYHLFPPISSSGAHMHTSSKELTDEGKPLRGSTDKEFPNRNHSCGSGCSSRNHTPNSTHCSARQSGLSLSSRSGRSSSYSSHAPLSRLSSRCPHCGHTSFSSLTSSHSSTRKEQRLKSVTFPECIVEEEEQMDTKVGAVNDRAIARKRRSATPTTRIDSGVIMIRALL